MIFKFVLACFACYRLSMLVAFDYGPFHIFEKIRKFLALRSSRNSVWHTVAELFHCQYCLGIWFSAVATPLIFIDEIWSTAILLFLAIPGVQSLFLEITNGRKED